MAAIPTGAINGGHFYSNIVSPYKVDVMFTVDSTNGSGVTSVKSNGVVKNVFMNAGTPSAANPNPAAGYALIQLKKSFNKFVGAQAVFESPVTGAALTVSTAAVLTLGVPYVITALGNTTLAEWQTIGLPVGLTPAVGQSFIAIAITAGGASTGTVKAVGKAGITAVEVIGDPTQSINNSNTAQNGGAWVMVQFLAPTDAATTTLIPTAPTAGSVCAMSLYFDGSKVTVDGL